jgi:hypothetical protein
LLTVGKTYRVSYWAYGLGGYYATIVLGYTNIQLNYVNGAWTHFVVEGVCTTSQYFEFWADAGQHYIVDDARVIQTN